MGGMLVSFDIWDLREGLVEFFSGVFGGLVGWILRFRVIYKESELGRIWGLGREFFKRDCRFGRRKVRREEG